MNWYLKCAHYESEARIFLQRAVLFLVILVNFAAYSPFL